MALPTHFWNKLLKTVCCICICLVVGYVVGRCDSPSAAIADNGTVLDTITYVDTVRYYQPVIKDSVVVRYVTAKLPIYGNFGNIAEQNLPENISAPDVAENTDSATVVVPISQVVYQDSTFLAWVSGYSVNLDSIYVMNRTDVITTTVYQPPKRWHVGISAGYGYSPKGFQPYVGIGLSYSLFGF